MELSALATSVYGHLFRGISYSPPSQWYVGFRDYIAGAEPTAGEYARVAYTAPAAIHPGTSYNSSPIEFPIPLSFWGIGSAAMLYQAASGGSADFLNYLGLYGGMSPFESSAPSDLDYAYLMQCNTPTAGDQITIDGVTYTFVSSLANPYDVLIAGASNSVRNLASAIMNDGLTTRYQAGTPAHPTITVLNPWDGEEYDLFDTNTGNGFILMWYSGAGAPTVDLAPSFISIGTKFAGGGEPARFPIGNFNTNYYVTPTAPASSAAVLGFDFASAVHDWLFGAGSYHVPVPYVALYTTMPTRAAGGADGVEVAAASYSRIPLIGKMNSGSWSSGALTGKNSSAIDWGTLTEDWGNIKGMALIDQYDPGGGSIEQFMVGRVFTTGAFDANNGDTVSILANGLTLIVT